MLTFAIATLSAVAHAVNIDHLPYEFHQFTQTESTAHTCLTSSERNKAPVADFWNIIAGTTAYEDSDFSPDKSSIYWPDMGEKLYTYGRGSTWMRAS